MENTLKSLCNLITEIANLNLTIVNNKLSFSEVKTLLDLVDVRRKGYLDLSDIYDLVGKVTEPELFAVFKYLDTDRTGEIRLEQLQSVFGDSASKSSQNTKEYIFPRFYKIVDTIKDKPKLVE